MVILLVILFIGAVVELVRFLLNWRKNNQARQALLKRQKEIQYINFLVTEANAQNSPIAASFPQFLNVLKQTVGWMYHSFFRLDETTQTMPIRFTGYLPPWYMEELSTKLLVKVGDASVGRAAATKQPVTINIAATDPRFQNVTSYSERSGYQSVSCYPVMGKLKTLGGFCAYGKDQNMFTLHDTQFLLTVANFYGAILENKLLTNYLTFNK